MDTIWNGDDEKHVLPSRCINAELNLFLALDGNHGQYSNRRNPCTEKGWHRIAFKKKEKRRHLKKQKFIENIGRIVHNRK